jgi:hypothetical protein
MYIDNFDYWSYIQDFSENFNSKSFSVDNSINYEKNLLGFRCDEFITTHKGKHLLFSGCSHTYGVGLKKEEVWAYKVYDKINKIDSCSGYFNIAEGGNNISNSILNIFKYCKQFGNPDLIFINLPSHSRFFNYKKDESSYRLINYKEFDDMYYIIKLINYNYYFMLEQYCNTNKIKLFSFSWDIDKNKTPFFETTNNLFNEYKFKTFHFIDESILFDSLFSLKQKYDNKFFDKARDGQHRGTGTHMFWSDFIYNKYLESFNK